MSPPSPANPANPANPGAALTEQLALVAEGDDRFVSQHPTGSRHVFGGLLVGQALAAAAATLPGAGPAGDGPLGTAPLARSLHASFVLAGIGGEPLHHEVERTRDGTSFATRRVTVRQSRGIVLVLTADFHRDEPGVEYEPPGSPDVPGPQGLAPGRYDNPVVESRDVPPDPGADRPPFARRAWFRVRRPLPPDPAVHQHALAYLSDHGPTRAAREPHAHLSDDARRQSVSLDHSVWFHRPGDTNAWLLSELVPVSTGRGRGLAIGTLRSQDGTLLATVAQEVLLRER